MVLLVLDDDFLVREAIKIGLSDKHQLLLASTFEQAMQYIETNEVDGAIVDINLGSPVHDGMEFLTLFKRKFPDKPVIIESGYRDVNTVVKSIKLGADDYLEKPFDTETLQLKVSKVFSDSTRNRVFKRAFDKTKATQQIIGKSPGILRAKQLTEEGATMRVLFYGETGVGKTPFAMYTNQIVSELDGGVRPFEQMNCACLNNEQFQDQLFGHKKGAFTGAITDKRGLVELARGGDLFLDEVGEMPLETQALFLTFLDSMEYYRLGDDVKRKADVRIIAATNRDLKKRVEEGKFRKDLYSRLAQVIVEIPPLRERPSDIPELVEYFVNYFVGYAKPVEANIMAHLQTLPWEEGNVRELRDAVEYTCLRSRGSDRIEMAHLGEAYRPLKTEAPLRAALSSASPGKEMDMVLEFGLENYLGYFEKDVLEKCLKSHKGSLDDMARRLQVSRPTLYRRLKKHRIPTPRIETLN